MPGNLIEGEDFYHSPEGLMVLTEKFHLKKGFCCGNGCRHCPYDYSAVPGTRRIELLTLRENEKSRNTKK